MSIRSLVFIIAGAVLVMAVSLWYFWYGAFINKTQIPKPDAPYQELLSENSHFLKGQQLLDSNNPKQAVGEFELALSVGTNNPAEEAQIKNKIAYAKELSGNPVGAISVYKEVAGDTRFQPIARAYAVQSMGIVYAHALSYGKEVGNEIFKDEPYRHLWAGNKVDSCKNLFEYTASIYPLAYSELWVANWYASKVQEIKNKDILSDENKNNIDIYRGLIGDNLDRADKEITRIKDLPNESRRMPEILALKALVASRLDRADELPQGLSNPEEGFRIAIDTAVSGKNLGVELSTSYYYAAYLASKFGSKRGEQIEGLLKGFMDGRYSKTIFYRSYFLGENDLGEERSSDSRLLASIAPGFKKFLEERGWKF